MIDATNKPFDSRGNLRSRVTFTWIGEIAKLSLREVKSKRSYDDIDEPPSSYSVICEDGYGFNCSFFRRSPGKEAAETMLAQIPTGVTLLIEGEVCIRRGCTYFNALRLKYPDDSPFMFRGCTPEHEEKPEEELPI